MKTRDWYIPFPRELTPEQVSNTQELVDALRSDKYKQATGKLKCLDHTGDVCHCCLGVGSEIRGCTNKNVNEVYQFDYIDGMTAVDLPHKQWWKDTYGWSFEFVEYHHQAFIDGEWKVDPKYEHDNDITLISLADMNDNGWSFSSLADLIEAVYLKREGYEHITGGADEDDEG